MMRGLLVGALALGSACDRVESPAVDSTPVRARNGTVPEMAPALVCEPELPLLASQGSLPLQWLEPSPPFVRRLDAVVPLSADRSAVVVEYGDFFAEGVAVLGFSENGTTVWEDRVPAIEELFQIFVEPVPDGTWLAGSEFSQTTVRRYAADGSQLVATEVDNVSATSVVPTPGGGLLLAGINVAGQPTFAELSPAGMVLWQSDEDLSQLDRVLADGVVQRLAPSGELLWEHDPRPVPFASFPLDVGASWARLLPSDRVLARGTQVAQGGDATLLLGLDSNGIPEWTHVLPYVSVDDTRVGVDGGLFARGRSWECEASFYAAVLGPAGDTIVEGRSASRVLGLDAHGRVVTRGHGDRGPLELEWIAQVPR